MRLKFERASRQVPVAIFVIAGCLVAIQVLLAHSSGAQSPDKSSGSSGVTLRSETRRVSVDIEVLEKGKPVQGIETTRFHVFEDGKERPIASFEEEKANPGPLRAKRPSLPEATYSNAPEYPAATAVNVLLLDGLNTSIQAQMLVRKQLIDYLGKIPSGTPLILFTLGSKLRLVQGFTNDPATFARTITNPKVNVRPSDVLVGNQAQVSAGSDLGQMGAPAAALDSIRQFEADDASFQREVRVRITLNALREIALYLSGISGRKNLIWFSGSFPVSLNPDPALSEPFSAMRDYASELEATNASVAAARVAVYPVDARGLFNGPSVDAENRGTTSPRGGGSAIADADRASIEASVVEHTTMEQIANQTGGHAFVNTNDLTAALAEAVSIGGNYYALTYEPGSTANDGKYHHIKVVVDGGSYSLSYRRGYFAESNSKSTIPTNLMLRATERGVPPSTQVLFESRVLPADADEIKSGPKIPDGPAGELAAAFKTPSKRCVVDSLVDANTIKCGDDSKGTKQCRIEITLVGYDSDGKRLNYVDRGVSLSFPPDLYKKRLETGVPVRTVIDLPTGQMFLRIAIRDAVAETVGSMEIPMEVAR